MWHWWASAALGLALTGRPVPLCAIVGLLPDTRLRRAYGRAVAWAFREPRHMERVTATYALTDLLRRY